jgi:hypothetical protein
MTGWLSLREGVGDTAEAIQDEEKCKITPTLIMQMGGKGNAYILCVYPDQQK